jgi:uncharacterized protein YndB with AHSA1/START domain
MMRPICLHEQLSHRPEEVWEVITDPRVGELWQVHGDFRPEAGAHFVMRYDIAKGWSGTVRGKVLAAHYPALLRYQVQADGEPFATTVTWTLEPTHRGGTHLILVHEGFVGVRGWLVRYLLWRAWRVTLHTKLPWVLDHRHGPVRRIPLVPGRRRARPALSGTQPAFRKGFLT